MKQFNYQFFRIYYQLNCRIIGILSGRQSQSRRLPRSSGNAIKDNRKRSTKPRRIGKLSTSMRITKRFGWICAISQQQSHLHSSRMPFETFQARFTAKNFFFGNHQILCLLVLCSKQNHFNINPIN